MLYGGYEVLWGRRNTEDCRSFLKSYIEKFKVRLVSRSEIFVGRRNCWPFLWSVHNTCCIFPLVHPSCLHGENSCPVLYRWKWCSWWCSCWCRWHETTRAKDDEFVSFMWRIQNFGKLLAQTNSWAFLPRLSCLYVQFKYVIYTILAKILCY